MAESKRHIKISEDGKFSFPKDGRTKHPLYSTYRGILTRCYHPSASSYKYYGGKGIGVCDRWRLAETGFWNFVEDMGRKPHPSWSVDRIRTDRDYGPSNCRWASPRTQLIRKEGGFTDSTNIYKTPNGHYRVRICSGKIKNVYTTKDSRPRRRQSQRGINFYQDLVYHSVV